MNSLSSLTASQMRFRTALFSWMIASVALLLLVAGVLRQQKASLLENLDSQAQGFAAAFRDAAAEGVIQGDFANVIDRATTMLRSAPLLDHLILAGTNGSLVSCNATSFVTDQRRDRLWLPEDRVASSRLDYVPELSNRLYLVSRPLDVNGIGWGWLHVAVRPDRFDAQLALASRRIWTAAGACVALALVASIGGARILIRPEARAETRPAAPPLP